MPQKLNTFETLGYEAYSIANFTSFSVNGYVLLRAARWKEYLCVTDLPTIYLIMTTGIKNDILLIEPYYSGSHKLLMDTLHEHLRTFPDVNVILMTLPGKKWHWRARTSALYFAQNIPTLTDLKCIFTSCVLPLHELLGLRSDLQTCKKVVYFHENQLVYPVRKAKDRDFQYGYNQIMTCLAADLILFNSKFNQESFLGSIAKFFKLQPDNRPKGLREQIEPKCQVLYFPLKLQSTNLTNILDVSERSDAAVLRIVWPHRWEFDKNPEMFFRTLFALKDQGITNFRVSVLGESFTDNPPIFEEARSRLADFTDRFGYIAEKAQYFQILDDADIIISTADHEFFGVAMLEGVAHKCFPLAPNKLVYPEIFPCKECLYDSEEDLFNRLKNYLTNFNLFENDKKTFFEAFEIEKYEWKTLQKCYINILLDRETVTS